MRIYGIGGRLNVSLTASYKRFPFYKCALPCFNRWNNFLFIICRICVDASVQVGIDPGQSVGAAKFHLLGPDPGIGPAISISTSAFKKNRCKSKELIPVHQSLDEK